MEEELSGAGMGNYGLSQTLRSSTLLEPVKGIMNAAITSGVKKEQVPPPLQYLTNLEI